MEKRGAGMPEGGNYYLCKPISGRDMFHKT